jgi:hypothetical protein
VDCYESWQGVTPSYLQRIVSSRDQSPIIWPTCDVPPQPENSEAGERISIALQTPERDRY